MSNLPDFNKLWDYDHPDKTEQAFRDLLPLAQSDPNYELELLTQIARVQGLQHQFDQGHETLDEVERRMTPETTVQVRLLLERGRLFNSAGDKEQARPLFEQVWELGQRIDEMGYVADAGHMLGILTAPDLTWNLKTLDMAENSGDERAARWQATLYNNIGWVYNDLGKYDEALPIFAKAVRLREERGNPQATRIARWAVAYTLRKLNRLDEALTIQRELAAQLDREGETDVSVEEELGEILLAQGRADEAKAHFARAYAELSLDEWAVEHEAERLEHLRVLGT